MPVTYGDAIHPVSLDFFQRIVSVHWGNGDIGILTLEAPSVSDFFFENVASNTIGAYSPGDTIPAVDYNGLVLPAARVISSDTQDISTLFHAAYTLWQIETIMAQPGTDPGRPPDQVTNYNNYVTFYNDNVAAYADATHQWITASTTLALPDPVAEGGVLPGSWSFPSPAHFTNHWADTTDAHENPLYSPFTGLHHYSGGYPDTSTTVSDPDIPGYQAFQQWDQWAAPELVGWGFGTHKVPYDKTITQRRTTWLLLFKNLTDDLAGTTEIHIGSFGANDPDLPSTNQATFHLQIYSGGTFQMGTNDAVSNVGGTLKYDNTVSVDYDTTADPVVKITKDGFL